MADYDDTLYYEEHSAANFVLTAEPTGDIDTPSFINQSAKFFKKPGVSIFKKKTLVLTDWTAEQWEEKECEEQIEYYSQCLKDGFELYVWQQPNELIKLSLQNIDLLKNQKFREKITPVKNSHISTLMVLKKIAAKQIKCLPAVDTIQLSKIMNSSHKQMNLNEYLISEYQGKITNDVFSEDAFTFRDELLAKYKDTLIFTENYKEIQIEGADIKRTNEFFSSQEIVEKFLAQLNNLDIYKVDLGKVNFLEKFSTSCKLQTLSLAQCKNVQFLPFQNQDLSALKRLDLSLTDIDETNLLKFIEMAPKLEILNLQACRQIKDFNLPDNIKNITTNLKELYLPRSFNSNTICAFLNSSKNIEKLKLCTDKLTETDCNNLSPGSLSKIKKIILQGEISTQEVLKQIINKTKNLEDLELQNENALDLKIFSPNTFDNLNSLTLFKKTFNIKDISYLLNKKPFLLSLSLHYKNTKEELFEILENAKHLKFLCLSSNETFFKLRLPSSISLNSLEKLILYRNDIDDQTLLTILKSTEKLTYLYLSDCYNINDWNALIKFVDAHLPNLDSKSKNELKKSAKAFNEKNKSTLQTSQSSNRLESKAFQTGTETKATRSESVDSDTTLAQDSFNVQTMFWGMNGIADPRHNEYRIQVCNTLIMQDDPKKPFKLENEGDLDLIEPENLSFHGEDTYTLKSPSGYYSKQEITLTSTWKPLGSLSSDERITDMHLQDLASSEVEVKYSKRDNLYYIKNKAQNSPAIPLTLNFRLTAKLDRSGQDCSSNIRELIKKYRNYKPGTLNISQNATGQERIKALQTQPVGACRHRSVAFKDEAAHLYPQVSVRTISNDCHMFVEVQEQKDAPWICCDLGGYEAKLNPDNSNAPTPELKVPPADPISLPANETYIDIESSEYNTWKTPAQTEKNLDLYTQAMLAGKYSDNKTLVTLDTPGMSDALALLLQKQCIDTDRPIFYAHSAEDLRCSANWIERNANSNQGTLRAGPGGALYEFIQANANNPPDNKPVFMINFDNLTTEEIIQFNSILDETRMVDGVAIPESFHVIGLYNTKKPGTYKGCDFLLRFEQSISCPFTPETLKTQAEFLTTFSAPKTASNTPSVIVDLYESNDWKALLVGQWTLEGEKLIFQEGQLTAALESAKQEKLPLEIKNGPWDNPQFVHFWQQARLNKTVDPDFTLLTSEGYDWSTVASDVKWGFNGIPQEAEYLLNPTTFNQYIGNYTFKKNQFYKKPGWLEEYKDKPLTLYLTRDLSKNQWGQLLACAQKNNVGLEIHVAPGVELPEGLLPVQAQPPINTDHSQVFITKDSDYVLDTLKKEHDKKSELLVLDISECEAADLLVSFKARWDTTNKNKPRYQFIQKRNALLKALKNGDTVILKGKFTPELTDALASLCLPEPYLLVNGKKEYYKGQSLFVTTPESEKAFAFTACTHVPVPEKYATKSYVQAQSEQAYLKLNPNSDPKANWEGLKYIEHSASTEDLNHEFDLSLEASEQFEKERLGKVNTALKRPFIFIAGKTGVGKSSFIKEVISKNKRKYEVHYGKEAYEAWITDTKNSEKTKILFLDEANIEGGDFSAFEGLYNTPPGMLINGTYHTLPINHKVIFAGNPQSYGRETPFFFERHGGSIVFPPLSEAYLYQHVLKPVFKGTNLSEQEQKNISQSILKTYRYINTIPGNAILISPRELQMMAVLASTTPNNKSYQDYYIHAIAQQCLPLQYKSEFTQWFGLPALPQSAITLPASNETKFVLTESRKEAYQKMDDFLKLRHFKQTTPNPVARYAGLGPVTK